MRALSTVTTGVAAIYPSKTNNRENRQEACHERLNWVRKTRQKLRGWVNDSENPQVAIIFPQIMSIRKGWRRNSFHVVFQAPFWGGFDVAASEYQQSYCVPVGPRLASAPWIRQYPQFQFSSAIRTTSAAISAAVHGRPGPGFGASIVLLGNQFPVPSKRGVRSYRS